MEWLLHVNDAVGSVTIAVVGFMTGVMVLPGRTCLVASTTGVAAVANFNKIKSIVLI